MTIRTPFAFATLALATLLVALLVALAGCHSAGPYGHSPRYVELSDETAAVAGAKEYDPVMVERQPDEWRKGRVVLFGVVESRTAGPGGQALLKLSVRRLEGRNLCESGQDDDTCRVTVSDKDFGVVYALVQVRGDDDVGPHAVGQRSLLRIVGTLGQDVAPDGAPIVHALYYRHWPNYFYVTRASARDMRQ
ncbi:MAG TPA: hypothetical protein VGG39_26255 [Polyangiaceae bacterium]|jgi:hypothetical protein